VPQQRQQNISLRNHLLRSKKRRRGVLSFLDMNKGRLRYIDTQQCFVKTKRPAAFLAKMSPPTGCSHAGDAKKLMHIHPSDVESRLQTRLHLYPPCHPPQKVTFLAVKFLKLSISWPDIYSRIQLFTVQNFSMIMRIHSAIPILLHTC